jgi:outer membrane protein insertion porin family
MTSSRPGSLRTVVVCLLCAVPLLAQQAGQPVSSSQTPSQQNPPQQPPPAKPQPPAQKKNNPFETIPQSTEQPTNQPPQTQPPKPQAPKLEAPKPAAEAPKPATPAEDVIDSINFRGARRVPQDTLRALVISKKGDKYDEEQLHRDFMVLWNTGRFDDLRMEKEPGNAGWIITYFVT